MLKLGLNPLSLGPVLGFGSIAGTEKSDILFSRGFWAWEGPFHEKQGFKLQFSV